MASIIIYSVTSASLVLHTPRILPRAPLPRLCANDGNEPDPFLDGLDFLSDEIEPPAVSDAATAPAPPPAVIPPPSPLPPPVAAATTTATPLLHQPLPQIILLAAGYLVHVCVLSRRHLLLGGIELGWDTITGLAILAAAAKRRADNKRSGVPPWLYAGRKQQATSMAAEAEANELADFTADGTPKKERVQLLATCALLLAAPLAFSYAAPVFEILLSILVIIGVPLNATRMLSARLILEQTSLYLLLGKLVSMRHPSFFSKKWIRIKWKAPWLLPTLGGYTASLALFNLVEPLNQWLLPSLAYLPEGIVAKLANPADRSGASLLLASIAPCIGAPLFEELQSRAFILQALTAALPISLALLVQGVLFGAQHLQIGLLLPLAVTGYFWGVLYVNSANLLVPILVHALWNARIFLGSYLGL